MLASLLGALLTGEAVASAKRLKVQIMVMAILGAIALVGAAFLLVAAYLYAAQRLGLLPAALWFGGGFIVTSLVGLIVYKFSAGARAKRQARRRKAEMTTMAAAAALAVLPALASRKGGLGLVIMPALAAVAYQIYKENTRRRGVDEPDDDV